MYKRYENSWLKHFDFLLADSLALQIAYIFAYLIRFGLNFNVSAFSYPAFSVMLFVISCCVAFFTESYHGILRRGYLKELKSSFDHVFLLMLVLIGYLFLTKQAEQFSRVFFICLSVFSVLFLWGFRCIYKKILIRYHHGRHSNIYNMMIFTTSNLAADLIRSFKDSNTRIIGLCLMDQTDEFKEVEGIPVVANCDTILDYMKTHIVDGLFVSLPEELSIPKEILDTSLQMGITTHICVANSDLLNSEQIVERMNGHTVLTSSVKIATVRQLFLKRVIDICAGLAGIILTGICFLFVAPAIYLASPGPIFFSQTRVGKNGRTFKMYKFRSMYMDAEERKKELMAQNKIQDGLMFKMDHDPRIIKGIGNFIRDYSIDELPQFWNVLKGDMSLIGTRPPTVEEYEKYDYHHKVRLAIKPGITGMWQVSGRSNITDFEEVIALDQKYITEWTLGLDLKILFKTFAVVLKKEGAE